MTFWEWLLNPPGLTPHGFGMALGPGLLWLHAGSDAATGLACLSIPLALLRLISLRPDLAYRRLAYLFGAFTLVCGLAHILAVYTLWVPVYGLEGLVKLAAALLSIAMAAILWMLIPRLAAILAPAQPRDLNNRVAETEAEPAADLTANAHLLEALDERATVEDALRESEFRMRMAVDSARLGIWEIDFVGNRGRMNARMAEITGGSVAPDTWLTLGGDEIVAWSDRVHPDDVAHRNAAVADIREGRRDTVEFQMRVAMPDGDWMWLTQWRAVLARAAETGRPTRAVCLFLDTTERARAELAIRAALSQRDLLLREVYHRVKNNLQIVDGLLLMQSRTLHDPQAAQALSGLRSRIYALGLVHAQLMSSKNLETLDIAPFLLELTQNIIAGGSSRDVVFEVEVCALEVDLDVAVPLGLLVTELVTNSLKHAFPDGVGTVRVGMSRAEDGGVILAVSDNGAGDRNASDTPGVGASIIAGLVAQLSGKLTVDRQEGRTTTILFPDLGSA